MKDAIRLNEKDNVAVCLRDLFPGDAVTVEGGVITARQGIPGNHKIALGRIAKGSAIVKYGSEIGKATEEINAGEWVHSHNMRSALAGIEEYTYQRRCPENPRPDGLPDTFWGYVREDGGVGIRNEIWVINTVGCINKTAETIARRAQAKHHGRVDGVFSFAHPYGCSQLGQDLENTQRILANMVRHPNAAGVLVLGLGCESNHIGVFQKFLGAFNEQRVKFLEAQSADDEYAAAEALVDGLVEYASSFKRQECSVENLTVGLKCGGSDALSGITANPLVGMFSDILTRKGGTTILTEVPEMFGAEQRMVDRCTDADTFDRYVTAIDSFKEYYLKHDQPIYENPSPGNKAGGITTLEEKSLGCVQKGGNGAIVDVLPYGGTVQKRGLNILEGPGNDLVSATNLASAGAQMIIFTTGRGTPFGTFVPTVKVSSGTPLFNRKPGWIDFDAGPMLTGEPKDISEEFYRYVIKAASGEVLVNNEINGFREIGLFKNGVTL
jgi:altronate hydrolase